MNTGNIQGDYLHQARVTVRNGLGTAELARLHKSIPWLDRLTPCVALGLFVLQAASLALLPFGFVWACLLPSQGVLIIQMVYIYHDLFVHCDVFKSRFSRVVA